jgi:long-chain acyl-CoA synthetase
VRVVICVDDRAGQTRDDVRVMPAAVPECPARTVDFEAVVHAPPGRRPVAVEVGPDDIAFLTYTSGTTGPPKAAVNTHGQVAWVAACWRDITGTTVDDVQLGMAPLFHVTGLVAVLSLALFTGAPVVLTYRFEPTTVLDAMRETRPTVVAGVITAFMALAGAPGARPEDFQSWRAVNTGGAPVAPATAARFEEATGKHLHPGYGLTETASACHLTPLGAASPVDPVWGALSVGIPIPGIDAMILDDEGRRLAPGEVGEIAVAGPSVIQTYWQRPEETAAAFTAGMFRTGDIGLMNDAGWFFVIDRKKDQINAGGYKVWPREVEDVLYQHAAVREVAVVGAPDEYRGETVMAHVSLQPGATVSDAELIAFAKERMAAYKYPRLVVFHDELPKTVSGKILRRELRT